MRLQVSGDHIPARVIAAVASLTDHARLRHAGVTHDPQLREVRLPIARFPLVKRRLLPSIHDTEAPIPSAVIVRSVVSCDIEDHTPPELAQEVQLLFGVQLEGKRVYACSAEESKGQTCFAVTLGVSELDVLCARVRGSDSGSPVLQKTSHQAANSSSPLRRPG